MKTMMSILALLLAAGLAAPALAQGMGGGGGGYGGEMGSDVPDGSELRVPSSGPGDPVGIAEEERLAGQCDKALPVLRRYAERGAGNEIAQFNLGECQIDLAAAEHDAKRAADLRQEGAGWILRAANAGFAKAQAAAVLLYLDATGVAADPVEADKWALLYRANGMRLSIGLPNLAPDISSRLDAALNDARQSEAQARADAWTQTVPAPDP